MNGCSPEINMHVFVQEAWGEDVACACGARRSRPSRERRHVRTWNETCSDCPGKLWPCWRRPHLKLLAWPIFWYEAYLTWRLRRR